MISDEELRAALPKYHEVIKTLGVSRKALAELDEWFRTELREAVSKREDGHLTRDELVKLMQWKLARGKFRPRLQQMIAESTKEQVLEATSSSHALLQQGKPIEALRALTTLRAVGPATASGILSCQKPHEYAMMSDEALEALGAPRAYTEKAWTAFHEEVSKRKDAWKGGAAELEQACYAAVAGKLIANSEEPSEARPTKKRKKG